MDWLKTRRAAVAVFVLFVLSLKGTVAAYRPSGAAFREMELPPIYDRARWMDHSLATLDLVVRGTPRRAKPSEDDAPPSAGELLVDEVLHGEVHDSCRMAKGRLKLVPPFRFAWGQRGVWMLLRTREGYFSLNPDDAPLDRAEGAEAARRANDLRPQHPKLREHAPEEFRQIYRTYRDEESGRDVWHGTDVSLGRGVSTRLRRHGETEFSRSWDRQGRLESVGEIGGAKGYVLRYHDGRLWRFSHYRDGKLEGVQREYYRDAAARPRREICYRRGVRHGPMREWDPQGRLTDETVYEEGLIAPVVHYEGEGTSGAKIHRSPRGVTYSAPHAVMDGLKVGMTAAEVSALLKADFSERSGIHFPTYMIDTYLHIRFENGRIAERKLGHNGVCVRPRGK